MSAFIHLHNHTEYSLLDGMLRVTNNGKGPSPFLQNLAKNKVPAMAMTDHGNMYGALEFYNMMNTVGVKPIIGCEFYYTAGKYTDLSENSGPNYHLTILAKDLTGYHNLMKLNSAAFTEGMYYKPRIDFNLLKENKEGLIVMSGCMKGELGQTALKKGFDEAVKVALRYRDMLGAENYYMEIMDHGIPEEQKILKTLLEVSKKTGIPLIATNDCHYEKREDWQAQEIHICIGTKTTLDDPKRLKMTTHEMYFKSPEEMTELFKEVPSAIKNTLEVAEKCNLVFQKEGFVMPDFPIPKEFEDYPAFLRHLCHEGLKKKLKTDTIPTNYLERLEYELNVIIDMGFAVYFLIVADFIQYARSQDIPVGPGRGSGAGSLVAYSMDITRVDPIKNKLLFERFLNPERVSMPDLDIDISDAGREEVINYMRRKYGLKNVASIITFGSLKAKSALKDVARVIGLEPQEANRLAKMIPDDLKATIASSMENVQEIKTEIAKNPNSKKVFDFACKVEGLKRHTGVHASGVLVTKEEVTRYTPLAKAKDVITTQYEGNTISDLKLLKIDFLGLKTLTVIDNTVKLIKKLRGIDIDIPNLPTDDKKTFELLHNAQTTGVFQLESSGMKNLVKRLDPSVFSDISALVALYRPGPMQSGMLDSFVNRKHGTEEVKVDHKLMEPVLAETYGTMIYQEQIMEVSKVLSGFTPGKADSLRKAMGKKKIDIMEKFRSQFIDGAKKNNCPEKVATKIFDQMAKFAEYGFNKSHSVAYALIAYQTAYLKANYPIEFMCASLTNEIGNNAIGSTDKENKIATYMEEAQKMGFQILPPDVQRSYEDFSVEKLADGTEVIRYALSAIKNVGSEACKNIVEERENHGPYKDLIDFCQRLDLTKLNKRALESLALAGAFDSLYPDLPMLEARAQAVADSTPISDFAIQQKISKQESAGSLFGDDFAIETINKPVLPKANAWTMQDLLFKEREVLGVFFSGHPLNHYKKYLPTLVKNNITEITENTPVGNISIAGIITMIKKRQSKKDKKPWAQIMIEDEKGSLMANVYSRTWENLTETLQVNQAVVLHGVIREQEDGSVKPEISVMSIESIGNALGRIARKLHINLPNNATPETLDNLKVLLEKTKGLCDVFLEYTEDGKKIILQTGNKIIIDNNLINFLETNFGLDSWNIENKI